MTAPAQSPAVVPMKQSKRDQVVERLNEQHALVLLGGGPAVLREGTSSDDRPEIRLLSVGGFHEWMKPYVFWENDRRYQASKVWFESEKRRQYEGLVFDPSDRAPQGYYNLWKGFAVQPNPQGSCQRLLDHVAENVCDGDEALFAWVMGWFAQMVQRPSEKLGTSLVLRGQQGTGKTILGTAVGSLLGPHYALVADSRYIVGRFNSHLASCLMLQLDEATWGGDHAAAGKLKDLITGEWQHIEYKGKEPVKVRNYVRLLVTGNNNWLIPAGLEERRFAVLDVAEHQRQNHRYFQAIQRELDEGGREALLHYLLTLNLADIPLREIPKTGALLEQKVASLTPEQSWWMDVLASGVLPGDSVGNGETEVSVLYAHYLERVQRMGVTRRSSETAFGIALKRMVPLLAKNRRSFNIPGGGIERRYIYVLPELAACRREFDRLTGEGEWTDAAASWQPDSTAKRPT